MRCFVVYFIATQTDRLVKIGYSRNPKTRIKTLQTSNPKKLLLIGVLEGCKKVEKFLHIKFYKYRIDGEWFKLTDEILEYIEANTILDKGIVFVDDKLYLTTKLKK
jgi:hypothetical protein